MKLTNAMKQTLTALPIADRLQRRLHIDIIDMGLILSICIIRRKRNDVNVG